MRERERERDAIGIGVLPKKCLLLLFFLSSSHEHAFNCHSTGAHPFLLPNTDCVHARSGTVPISAAIDKLLLFASSLSHCHQLTASFDDSLCHQRRLLL